MHSARMARTTPNRLAGRRCRRDVFRETVRLVTSGLNRLAGFAYRENNQIG
jgi:hypothetical protein